MVAIPPPLTDIIKRFEGLCLSAYRCTAGIWTIGYGHTGCGIYEGMRISVGQANALLYHDAIKCLTQVLKDSPILAPSGENRISAVGDFVFNLGINRYKYSTFKKRIDDEDWSNAAMECNRWIFSGGNKLKDLIARREVEDELLLG
ncbi:MAG: lysozyme [Candidatus Liberibacter ctenarytainae]|uniref:Lysozyme n=1 Tax=Candidatus Liberibacter ctenarytainae TaxID=2020335 RepID=A0A937AFE8_9HYPH|nr:lysozyme [Candidatus Liberibacter ctenarytainae]